MSVKLFNPTTEGHDPKNRPVFICKDGNGFHVYKPGTGYRSRNFKSETDADLLNIFEYQKGCSQNTSFYRPGDDKKLPQPKAASKPKQTSKAPATPPVVEPDEIYTV